MQDRVVTERPAEGKRRPGRPTLTNEQLLDTALDLFLENGFERTSIDAIAAAAGMAKRTVYARYEDKNALFIAALTRAIEEWIVPVDELRAVETDDFEDTLLAIGRILVANVLRPGGLRLLRLTNAVAAQMPEVAAFNVQKGTEPTLAYLADLFVRRLGSDQISREEADFAAQAFIDLVPGGPANAGARGVVLHDDAVDRHTQFGVRLFLHGLLPMDHQRIENERLQQMIAATLDDLERVRDRLQHNGDDQY